MFNFKCVLIFVLSALLSSCDKQFKSGKYSYVSADQRADITVNENGEFHQTIKYFNSGQILEIDGVWRQKNSVVYFEPFLKSVADGKHKSLFPPTKHGSVPGIHKGGVLIFDEQSEYWFRLIE